MNTADIFARLEAARVQARSTQEDLARLTMLALATDAREKWPHAAHIELEVTDQDFSGSLNEIDVKDADGNDIPGGESIDVNGIGWYLDDTNKSVWLPFMTPDERSDKYRSDYLLIIDKVLAEIAPEEIK